MGKSKKNEKKSNTVKNVFLNTIFTVLKIVVPLAFLAGILLVIFIIAGAEKIDVEDLTLDINSVVCYVDEDGEIQEYEKVSGVGNRFWVPLNKVPQNMQEAFISIEDERFRSHNGVDIKRTTKAVIDYIFNRDTAQGGSTITQQLVKNITGNDDRSPIRKIQEMWMAFQLERKMSKDQILELYVNTIYLAQGVNGVQTASKLYFDKNVWELSLAQCASIAGITQYPAYYDPFLQPENNKVKQEIILDKMLELGKITQEEHDTAVAEELHFKKGNMQVTAPSQSYFTEQVIADVVAALVNQKGMSETVARRKVSSGGYKIVSTLDPVIQSSINDVFTNTANFPKAPSDPAPQGAIVVIDVHTGEVKGLYGGIGPKPGAYMLNRATGTFRQPGSSIKPLGVYAPAVDSGLIGPSTIYTDQKVTYGDWSPKNFYTGFKGDMTVSYAIQQSVNTVAVQIVDDLGIEKSYDYLKNKFHLSTVNESDKVLGALSLGGLTKGVSVMDMAAAYSVFPNDGVYNTPITFTKIIDNTGKVILKNKSVSTVAISKKSASTMNALLRGVVTGGTGASANIAGETVAGKTGTTDDDKDRWFVGYNTDYCGAVWYGYDTPKPMTHLTNNPALNAWKKVMQNVFKHRGNGKKLNMDKVSVEKSVEICETSGLLPTDFCHEAGTVVKKKLADSAVPAEQCSKEKHSEIPPPENADNPSDIVSPPTQTEGKPPQSTVTPPSDTENNSSNSGNSDNADNALSELEQILGRD